MGKEGPALQLREVRKALQRGRGAGLFLRNFSLCEELGPSGKSAHPTESRLPLLPLPLELCEIRLGAANQDTGSQASAAWSWVPRVPASWENDVSVPRNQISFNESN